MAKKAHKKGREGGEEDEGKCCVGYSNDSNPFGYPKPTENL